MIGKAHEIVEWLFQQDKDKVFEIKVHREKRSLTANAYAWALISQMADVLRTDKESVYLTMLKRYGQSSIVTVRNDVDISKYFKYWEKLADRRLGGIMYTHYKVFVGSSEYDTREMAILIDGVISEAESMGISTIPRDEVERLKGLWKSE